MARIENPEFPRVRAAILRELERKGVSPLRALKLRIFLYSNLRVPWRGQLAIKNLWTIIHNTLKRLVADGEIVQHRTMDPNDPPWYALPPHFPGGNPSEETAAELLVKSEARCSSGLRQLSAAGTTCKHWCETQHQVSGLRPVGR